MRVPNVQSLVRGQMVKGVLEAYPNKTYVVVQGKAAAAVITCDPTIWCDPLRTRLAPQQEMRKTMSGQAGIGRRTLPWAWWNCTSDSYICPLPLQSWWHFVGCFCWHWQACWPEVCTSLFACKALCLPFTRQLLIPAQCSTFLIYIVTMWCLFPARFINLAGSIICCDEVYKPLCESCYVCRCAQQQQQQQPVLLTCKGAKHV
jgi:hypothetical protein